jgi:hypothetical protein
LAIAGDPRTGQTRASPGAPAEPADAGALAGGQGTDWFFANRIPDNGGALDQVSDLAANELWNDTDF